MLGTSVRRQSRHTGRNACEFPGNRNMKTLNRIIGYFDLFSGHRGAPPIGRAGGGADTTSNWWLLAHFVALFLGIIAKVFVDSVEDPDKGFALSWTRLIVAVITAGAIYPAVYRNAMDTANPGFVQCCVTFAAGLGYKTLIDIEV